MDMKSIRFPPPVADDMVRAILNNRKTVTRRVVQPQPTETTPDVYFNRIIDGVARWGWRNSRALRDRKLPYRPGDILYVRETWQYAYDLDGNEQPIEGTGRYLYAANRGPEPFGFWVNPDGTHRDSMPWRPSIHMPREAARIFLRVTEVRVERLQEITMDGLLQEGVLWDDIEERDAFLPETSARWLYERLWNGTIKKTDRALYGWDANPWVWVIEFERISKEEVQHV